MATSMNIFVDGACKNNGQPDAQAGCGVFWGINHRLNISERLYGTKHTNNRAELSSAIIALTQAQSEKLEKVEISTDSKYMKCGITKWIHSWKSNNWKSSKNEVLNKDLWEILDNLCQKVKVEWTWVAAHSSEIGNIEADKLAKIGITSDSCNWQEQARFVSLPSIGKDTQVVDSVELTSVKSVYDTNDISKCDTCQGNIADKDGLQCQNCLKWIHYTCSRLPAYQLYVFEHSQRKFTCEKCIVFDTSSIERIRKILKDQDHDTSNPSNKRIFSTRNLVTRETQTIEKESEGNKFLEKALNEFKSSTIDSLQSSFIEAIDRLIHTKNNDNIFQTRFEKLQNENFELKRKLDKVDKIQQLTRVNCECEQIKEDAKKNKEIAFSLQNKLSDLALEMEEKLHHQKSEGIVLREKLDAELRKSENIKNELITLEKRISIKNEDIENMEQKLKEKNSAIMSLQDEILSWKMHHSRQDDTLLEYQVLDSNKKPDKTDVITEQTQRDICVNDKQTTYKENPVTTNTTDKGHGKKGNTQNNKEGQKKKKLLFVGTSNTKFIKSTFLQSDNLVVDKEMKYTFDEAKTLLQSKPSYDIYVLHLGGNDLTKKSAEVCADEMENLCKEISATSRDSKIIVSLGIPRKFKDHNYKVEKFNVLLKEKFCKNTSIALVDNGNLFYRGQAAYGIVNESGIHLTRKGTQILSRNIRESIDRLTGTKRGRNFSFGYNRNQRRSTGYGRSAYY